MCIHLDALELIIIGILYVVNFVVNGRSCAIIRFI